MISLSRNLFNFLSELNESGENLLKNESLQEMLNNIEIETKNIEAYLDRIHYEIPDVMRALNKSENTNSELQERLESVQHDLKATEKKLDDSESKAVLVSK